MSVSDENAAIDTSMAISHAEVELLVASVLTKASLWAELSTRLTPELFLPGEEAPAFLLDCARAASAELGRRDLPPPGAVRREVVRRYGASSPEFLRLLLATPADVANGWAQRPGLFELVNAGGASAGDDEARSLARRFLFSRWVRPDVQDAAARLGAGDATVTLMGLASRAATADSVMAPISVNVDPVAYQAVLSG